MDETENHETRETQVPTRIDDPAPRPTQLPLDRASQLVKGITLVATDQLRTLRDETDALIKALQANEERIARDFVRQADFAEQAILVKSIMQDSLVELRKKYENGGAVPVAPTMTQDKEPS